MPTISSLTAHIDGRRRVGGPTPQEVEKRRREVAKARLEELEEKHRQRVNEEQRAEREAVVAELRAELLNETTSGDVRSQIEAELPLLVEKRLAERRQSRGDANKAQSRERIAKHF